VAQIARIRHSVMWGITKSYLRYSSSTLKVCRDSERSDVTLIEHEELFELFAVVARHLQGI